MVKKKPTITMRLSDGRTMTMEDRGTVDLDKEVVMVRGKRLTEKRAEALVAALHRRDRGRPSLSTTSGPRSTQSRQ